MNHPCHFCNRCFDIHLARIQHESKCGYECLLYNSESLEQNPPPMSTLVRVMQYMASQLNELQIHANATTTTTENKKPILVEQTIHNSNTNSKLKPLRVLQNNTHPSETLSSFFQSHILSYIPKNINTVFEKGLCEGMKCILQEALTDYQDVLPIQGHIVKLPKYYGYVFSEDEKIYEWIKLPVGKVNELFNSLETEIIDYFDNVWKQENIQILDNLDKFYHYVGQVTGENDCVENVRNKQLRTIVDTYGAIKCLQPTNDCKA